MNIILAEKKQSELLYNFIKPYEFACCGLSAIIRRFSEPIYIITQSNKIESSDDILGLFSFNHSIFHCLPNLKSFDSKMSLLIQNFFADKKINSIIGERSGTEYIYSCINKVGFETEQQVFYNLMTLAKKPELPPDQLYNDDEIRRCTINDLDELHSLQKEYMETEIAPVGRHITDLETKASLKQILKNQICLAMFSDLQAVSKINTNAIGVKWVQIGGVFTHPMFRHNYYAWHLLYILCIRILKTGRIPCLFVKEKNISAYSLYERIGFEKKGKFAIFYLKQ